jgi:hypothetical protein
MRRVRRLLEGMAVAAVGALFAAGAYAEAHRVPGQP